MVVGISGKSQVRADIQSIRLAAAYTYEQERPGTKVTVACLDACGGGTNMKGFFNQDGFEVVIWILVIIFLLSIFFDEGID